MSNGVVRVSDAMSVLKRSQSTADLIKTAQLLRSNHGITLIIRGRALHEQRPTIVQQDLQETQTTLASLIPLLEGIASHSKGKNNINAQIDLLFLAAVVRQGNFNIEKGLGRIIEFDEVLTALQLRLDDGGTVSLQEKTPHGLTPPKGTTERAALFVTLHRTFGSGVPFLIIADILMSDEKHVILSEEVARRQSS